MDWGRHGKVYNLEGIFQGRVVKTVKSCKLEMFSNNIKQYQSENVDSVLIKKYT